MELEAESDEVAISGRSFNVTDFSDESACGMKMVGIKAESGCGREGPIALCVFSECEEEEDIWCKSMLFSQSTRTSLQSG